MSEAELSRALYSHLMPNEPCGHCGKAKLHANSDATQFYVVCDACAAVWVLDRSNPNKPPCLGMQRPPRGPPATDPVSRPRSDSAVVRDE